MEPLESKSLLDIVWVYYRMSRDDPRGFRVILETREWLGCDASFPQRDELAAVDHEFLEILKARMPPLSGEPVCAAVGYVEFLFHHKAMLPLEDPAHRDEAVRAMLEKVLHEENA